MKRKLAAVVVVLGLAGAAWVARDLYRPYRGFTGDLMVEIAPGMDGRAIAGLLVERGVLAHRIPFLIRYGLGRAHKRLEAGEYFFDRPLRPIDVYRKLILGEVYLHPVVIPEGSDRFDMARVFEERMGIDPAAFLRTTEQTALIQDLDPQAPSLEGYLFPDTYRFPRRTVAATVVATMLARFRHVLQTRFHNEMAAGLEKLHAAISLASLVEKETPNPAERPMVAGVFTRRLEKGMPLQCDPTVVYAARIAHRAIGAITTKDLNFDSPFNTYRHAGLPPGPIASPGEASIRAAFHPDDGDTLYFVSNNHGGHIFAANLAEHQRNVAHYRREVAALRRAASQKPDSPGKSSTTQRKGDSRKIGGAKKDVSRDQQKADHS